MKQDCLKFDINNYIAELVHFSNYVSEKDWYHNKPYDTLKTAYAFAKELELRRFYNIIWLRRFNGKIPANWEHWRNIYVDLERRKLKSIEIDAAITHPAFIVAKKAARTQKLNLNQMTWFLSRPYFLDVAYCKQEIIRTQQSRGFSNNELEVALSVSEKVKEKLIKWHLKHKGMESFEGADKLLHQEISSLGFLLDLASKVRDTTLDEETRNKCLEAIKKGLNQDFEKFPGTSMFILLSGLTDYPIF